MPAFPKNVKRKVLRVTCPPNRLNNCTAEHGETSHGETTHGSWLLGMKNVYLHFQKYLLNLKRMKVQEKNHEKIFCIANCAPISMTSGIVRKDMTENKIGQHAL